ATGVDVVFHGDDFKHYFAAYSASWNPAAEPVGGAQNQSAGPSPASIVVSGSDAIVAFAGNNHDLFDQDRTGGIWQPANGHGLGDAVVLTPAMIALSGGNATTMIAYVRKADSAIVYTVKSGANWSAPDVVDKSAFSGDAVALLPLAGGAALLAYRG